MKLSVILPTINRSTLALALASCQGATEVLVVADGPEAHGAEAVFQASGLPGRVILLPRRHGDYGHTPRNIALDSCTGDWIAHMDDDDWFVPDYLDLLQRHLNEPVPHFFRVGMGDIGVVWREPRLYPGNISTLGIVHPNDKRWGVWGRCYGGDHDFAASTAANYSHVRWVDAILARTEAHHFGKDF